MIEVVKVDVAFDLVNNKGNSSESFVEVVVVSEVTDGVEDPGEEDLEFVEVVYLFGGLLNFLQVRFPAFFLGKSRELFVESVQSLPDEVFHAVLVE